jgi:hypothetical protein
LAPTYPDSAYYIPLVFNFRNPILARPEVRRAIFDAIDREEIVSQGCATEEQVADDPIWPFIGPQRLKRPPPVTKTRALFGHRRSPASRRIGTSGELLPAQMHVLQRRPQFERIGFT